MYLISQRFDEVYLLAVKSQYLSEACTLILQIKKRARRIERAC